MTQELVIEIASRTLFFTMIIAAPILVTGLVVGLLVSIFQTVTQIREMTLTFIPKIAAVLLVMLFTIPWMLNRFMEYMNYIINILQTMNR